MHRGLRPIPALGPLLLGLALGAPPAPAAAQAVADAPVRVYLDCQTFGCDQTFFRTEIQFVDWVAEREAADVHLLVSGQASGGGGRQFTVAFLGQRRFAEEALELRHSTSGDATQDDMRRALADQFRLGLVGFAARTSARPQLRVSYEASAADSAGAAPARDPWDFWVITLGLNGNASGESSTAFLFMNTNLSASRVTDAWKIGVGGNYIRNRQRFQLSDREVIAVRTNWGANGVVVKTLTAHWSAGARLQSSSNSAQNQDLALSIGPGIEFNVFPYAESTRRSLTLQYLMLFHHLDWESTTIYGQDAESHPGHSAVAAIQLTQPWGNVRLNLSANQYLHDPAKYNVQLGGNMSWRLFRGFSLNLGGNYARIRDQLFLPRGDLSDDEILTEQRQLATGYRYFTFFGVSYRFGSINNNVVNPRFGPDLQQGQFFF